MPYDNESSSLSAAAKFNKEYLDNKEAKNYQRNDRAYISKMINALEYLDYENKQNKNDRYIKTFNSLPTSSVYEKMFSIDGSVVDIGNGESFKIGLQVGAAYIETADLLKPLQNSMGSINPALVGKIYNNPNNISLQGFMPGRNNYYLDDNGIYLSQKQSFIKAIEHIFNKDNQSKKILNFLLQDLNIDSSKVCQQFNCPFKTQFDKQFLLTKTGCGQCTNTASIDFNNISLFSTLVDTIRDDMVFYETRNETTVLMLLLENVLASYLVKYGREHVPNIHTDENLLILLDGRLHNKEIGNTIKNWANNTTLNNHMIGVQKSGLLNNYLSKIHELFNSDYNFNGTSLDFIVNSFKDGNGLYIAVNKKFQKLAGLPQYETDGKYANEYLYITSNPTRNEFVFTLPTMKGLQPYVLSNILGTLENTYTNLYPQSKGALIANVLAHDQVSLNKKLVNQVDKHTENVSNNNARNNQIPVVDNASRKNKI